MSTGTTAEPPGDKSSPAALDRLSIATRVHAVPTHAAIRKGSRPSGQPTRPPRLPDDPDQPQTLLVFDTETLVDHTQALTFGVWRFHQRTPSGWKCAQEGLFHADDLQVTDPTGFAALQRYAATRRPAVDGHRPRRIPLYTRTEFVEKVFFEAAWKGHARVVGFNLPFDLSRVAVDVADGRGPNLGGFSFVMAAGNTTKGYAERRHRPRLRVKHLNRYSAFISFARALEDKVRWDGDFVDLRTLTFALTGRGHTLDSACHAFGVNGKADPGGHGTITPAYIDYCRQDVAATADLYLAAEQRLLELGVPLTPPWIYSPASLAKGMLRGMGVRPVLERHPDTDPGLLGIAMSTFYGGRAECRIRRTPVPVRLVDFTSTYPTLFALMGIWSYVIADRIDVRDDADAVAEVQQLLDTITVDGCFDPALYSELVGFAQIVPDGDVVPVRAQYSPDSPSWGIGHNHLTSDEPLWYALPDLVASVLITHRAPTILRALCLVPVGLASGLEPLMLPGGYLLDPRTEDPWKVMTEQRQRVRHDPAIPELVRDGMQLFFKITSNAGAFGIWAEYNTRDLPAGKLVEVTVNTGSGEPFTNHVYAPEDPGRYCYPPLAAVVTAAARLVLSLTERCVTDLGGSWAVADTDSMAIVSTATGGLIPCLNGPHKLDGRAAVRALTHDQVDEIRQRFDALNPYDRTAVRGTILKTEVDSWCYAIAAKRYALFRYDHKTGLPRLVPADEHAPCSHGLGHLLNPIDPDENPDGAGWIVQLWEQELALALTPHLAGPPPAWYDGQALARVGVTSPRLLKFFYRLNQANLYSQQVKPFNFLMFAPGAHPPAGTTEHVRLVAPYARQHHWKGLRWINLHQPNEALRLSSDPAEPNTALQDTYATTAGRYLTHPERKSAQERRPCGAHTTGLLERCHVRAKEHRFIGKESNRLDERESGQVTATECIEPQLEFRNKRMEWLKEFEAIKLLEPTLVHQDVVISARRLKDIQTGRVQPRSGLRRRLLALARKLADTDLE